ncbi:sensor histidine kinase [Desertimonas flava]|jgi:two-component sensor histidine kinase|uniref:sensor histidine kinase n=1 Tax=Desertimonas flava TaxID=2064846 RepID=UPI000E34BDBC|nr:PAS domain-containing sensor histidine kinase [Desertimonas flava]
MASLAGLVREHTTLDREQVSHLNRLTSEWGLLADLSFSDLLLYAPGPDDRWLIIGQVRPATGQTVYRTDWVGTFANSAEQSILASVLATGEITEGDVTVEEQTDPARMLAVPVRHAGRTIAVMTREWVERSGRVPGELERQYVSLFDRFAGMIADGVFPYAGPIGDSTAAPRVGDGVLVVDGDARVQYLSPNANSAMHRVGINANAVGMRLAELGFYDDMVRRAFEDRTPVVEEFEQSSDVVLLCRCMPILSDDKVTGGVLLIRDVTDVRQRDRMLLSKDATIREIHHRVKNNLQTISSLLRLQARRLTNPEAVAAVGESVRRIRTIALVHESLSREPGDDVTFIEIVRPLLRLAEESLQSPDRPVEFSLAGDGGRIPARVATPLSVVLTELMQNAVDHGFPEGSAGGRVVVSLTNDGDELSIDVVDDGKGLDPSFKIEAATGLGLSIVRTLVTTELNGTITMRPAKPVDLESVGLEAHGGDRQGTVVQLVVPLSQR